MSKCRMWTKKPTSEKCKFGSNKKLDLEWTTNGLGKPFRKKFDPKNRKKIKVKLPQVNKKPLAKPLATKRIFVQTPFSLYFKIRATKFHAVKPLAFSLHFLFRRDQNHSSNLTSKIMKMCEHILNKTAPQYNSNSFELLKTKRMQIIAPAIAVRLLNVHVMVTPMLKNQYITSSSKKTQRLPIILRSACSYRKRVKNTKNTSHHSRNTFRDIQFIKY